MFSPLTLPSMVRTGGLGAFVGYNWQRGNWVYGGELSYTNFSTGFVGFPGGPVQSDALEARARVGYAFGPMMAYGFVGAAQSNWAAGLTSLNQTGYTYGVGIERFVTQSMTVGLELASRDVRGSFIANTLGTTINTLSLRAGFHF